MPSLKLDKAFAQLLSDNVDEAKVVMSTSCLDIAIEFIRDECNPDDVFTDEQLSSWAESNGYKKED